MTLPWEIHDINTLHYIHINDGAHDGDTMCKVQACHNKYSRIVTLIVTILEQVLD